MDNWLKKRARELESKQTSKTGKYLGIQPVMPNSAAHQSREDQGKKPVEESQDPEGRKWIFYWE
jgi:hypothetical protein